MTGVRKSWRGGQATRADETPAAAPRNAKVRIQAIPTHGAERFDPSNPACRRANSSRDEMTVKYPGLPTVIHGNGAIAEVMSRTAREFLAKEEGGLPNLAVISSVAPFIGLFGTVWGIMSSFAGIAQSQDTSLAVVAPGIAEALAATAYGLAAAIPASVGYNRIGAAFSRVGQNVSHYIEDAALAHVSGRPVPTHKREAA